MKFLKIAVPILIILFVAGCFLMKKFKVNPPINLIGKSYEGELPLDKIKLPDGFRIDVYAENVENARSICLSPSGILYVDRKSVV